jgi:hypothetical protein
MARISLKQPSDKVLPERLVDEVIAHYVGWREASAAVDQAYGNWCNAAGPERGATFAAYSAALDGEESAARSYGALIGEIRGRYGDERERAATA